MNKITVKEFVEGYNKCVDSLKNRYIQEKVKHYILLTCKH